MREPPTTASRRSRAIVVAELALVQPQLQQEPVRLADLAPRLQAEDAP